MELSVTTRAEPSAAGEYHELVGFTEEFKVQEPEVEDEAEGWEIVEPAAAGGGRRRSSSAREYSPFVERASAAADEPPEDLVMGCLDRRCTAHFHEGCERHRCACCRFHFCSEHIRRCPVKLRNASSFSDLPLGCSSSATAVAGCGSAGPTATLTGALLTLADCLGLPTGPEPAALCKRCQEAILPATPAQARATPLALGPVGMSDLPTATPSAPSRPSRPSASWGAIDVVAIAAEAADLHSASFSGVLEAKGEEAPRRKVARELLKRLLERLRVCLRPWTEYEREWVWRIRDALCEADASWVAQFARQVRWDIPEEVAVVARLVERVHDRRQFAPRDALQVLSVLGRHATQVVAALGERQLGVVATHAAEALAKLSDLELACSLELLLDAGHNFGAVGATGGRRAVVQALVRAACDKSATAALLRGELFWALEARSKKFAAVRIAALTLSLPSVLSSPSESCEWAGVAVEDLLRNLPADAELALLRQRTWVRHLERGEKDAARVEPWGEQRAFPLAVWPPHQYCLGMEGEPREMMSKNAPVIIRCRWQRSCSQTEDPPPAVLSQASEPGWPPSPVGERTAPAPAGGAGLLLKRDAGMHLEQQVGQTLRLLELLIWEDPDLQTLLEQEGLRAEDVRVTYVIAMTGPGVGIVEFVEGAKTLRDVREGRGRHDASRVPLRERFLSQTGRGTLLSYLQQHNSKEDLKKALARLAFTSAVSAVLSFVAGLGDRHHENFMATIDGRLLHVDYGYALGREPLDSVLIHAVTGGRPATLLQYEELMEALGPHLLQHVFWPTVCRAYIRVRQHAGLFTEMVFVAMARDPSHRDPRGDPVASQRAWATAQEFVARRCAPTMCEPSADQFVKMLLRHCARHEAGARLRDGLKGLCLRERTHQGMLRVCNAVIQTGLGASSAMGVAAQRAVGGAAPVLLRGSQEATAAARDAAAGLLVGVRGLLADTGAAAVEDRDEGH